MTKIKPTIGRVVWFYPSGHREGAQPHAAMIAFVHSDSMVNLGVLDPNGRSYNETSVSLIQGGNDVPQGGRYATWMPFQIGQAKRAEAEPVSSKQDTKPVYPLADGATAPTDAGGFDGHDIADVPRDGSAAGQQTQQASE